MMISSLHYKEEINMIKFTVRSIKNKKILASKFKEYLLDSYCDYKCAQAPDLDLIKVIDLFHEQITAAESLSDGLIHLHKGESYQDRFESFMNKDDGITYSEMRQELKQLYQQSEKKADKYTNEKVAHQYRYLQYVGYLQLCTDLHTDPFYCACDFYTPRGY